MKMNSSTLEDLSLYISSSFVFLLKPEQCNTLCFCVIATEMEPNCLVSMLCLGEISYPVMIFYYSHATHTMPQPLAQLSCQKRLDLLLKLH